MQGVFATTNPFINRMKLPGSYGKTMGKPHFHELGGTRGGGTGGRHMTSPQKNKYRLRKRTWPFFLRNSFWLVNMMMLFYYTQSSKAMEKTPPSLLKACQTQASGPLGSKGWQTFWFDVVLLGKRCLRNCYPGLPPKPGLASG